jgi:hypothetical protein
MLGGFIGALSFLVACWFAPLREWHFGLVLLSGTVAWLAVVLVAGRWLAR